MEIDDEELRTLAITGMPEAGNTESFVELSQRLPGVRVERTSGLITVPDLERQLDARPRSLCARMSQP